MSQTEKVSAEGFAENLNLLLKLLNEKYEYIFIDAQAGTDIFAEIAVGCSDDVVIVSEYDPMSVQGIERLKKLFSEVTAGKRVWTLFNKVLPEFVPAVGQFLAIAGYLVPIPWDADVVRAYVQRRTPIDIEDGNTHTVSVVESAGSLFGSSAAREIEEWKRNRTEKVRAPAREKLREVDEEIKNMEEEKVNLKFKRQRRFERIGYSAGLLSALLGVMLIILSYYNNIIPYDVIYNIFGTRDIWEFIKSVGVVS